MSKNDLLSDMLTRIRNSYLVKKTNVKADYSNLCFNVLKVLKNEGYITDFNVVNNENNISYINIVLKYFNGEAAIKEVKRVSKPGRRVYSKIKDLNGYYNNLGIVIVSTCAGVLTDYEAQQKKVGGEILCKVF